MAEVLKCGKLCILISIKNGNFIYEQHTHEQNAFQFTNQFQSLHYFHPHCHCLLNRLQASSLIPFSPPPVHQQDNLSRTEICLSVLYAHYPFDREKDPVFSARHVRSFGIWSFSFLFSPSLALPFVFSKTKFTESWFQSPLPIFWLTRFQSFFNSAQSSPLMGCLPQHTYYIFSFHSGVI